MRPIIITVLAVNAALIVVVLFGMALMGAFVAWRTRRHA
jgi:hypothetical protein